MIGDGPCREPLERLAGELGVADRVRFLGQLPNPEAVARAAACDLFVMPGVEEPFGVAFVEAMAAGLPAIGSRGEGGPEDIAAAGPGMILVEPDDPGALATVLDRLTADRAELARLGAAARETVAANFTWERCGGGDRRGVSGSAGRSRPGERPVDVLLVSLGTTRGLRLSDAQLVGDAAEAGASVEAVATRIGWTNALRRGYPVNDVVEAVAARRALDAGMRGHRPRALVISSTTAALLVGRPAMPFAVWLDSPARLNRPGALNAPLHWLERRQLARARVLMPHSPGDGRGAPGRRRALGAGAAAGPRGAGSSSGPRGVRGRVHARPEGQGARAALRGVGAGGAARGAAADRRHPARAGAGVPGAPRDARCRPGPSSSGCCPSPSSAICWRAPACS